MILSYKVAIALVGLVVVVLIAMISAAIASSRNKTTESYHNPTSESGQTIVCNPTKPITPERVRIIKNTDTSFKVHFYYPSLDVNQFVIVIMQYTHEMEPIGELKILVSDEAQDTAICQKNTTNTGYNCGMTHTFSHIIPRDKYNKCGDISDFVEPYNVSLRNEKRLFAMTTLNNSSTAAQQQQQTNSNDIAGDTMIYDGIEPQFHHLSKQLGGYPYQALVTGKSAQQNLLDDLLDQSLADNIVNINVTV
jgi:hypothetical protein